MLFQMSSFLAALAKTLFPARLPTVLLGGFLLFAAVGFSGCDSFDSLGISGASEVVVGENIQLTATFTTEADGQQDVTGSAFWYTSDTEILTVNSNTGQATGVSDGVTQVHVNYGGLSAAYQVTVTGGLVSVTIGGPATVAVGGTAALSATYLAADGTTTDVTNLAFWYPSNSTVISVNSGMGQVTGVAPGQATVFAGYNGLTGTHLVSVQGLAISGPTSVGVAATIPLTATHFLSDGTQQVVTTLGTWSTVDTTISVNAATGVVTGVSDGPGTVQFSYAELTAAYSVTVSTGAAAVGTLTVSPATATVPNSGTLQLTASHSVDGDVTSIATWSTALPGVATVNGAGMVSWVADGFVTITASYAGLSAGANLTSGNPLVSLVVNPEGGPNPLPGMQRQYRAVGTFADASTKNLTPLASWSSDNTTVASVTPNSGFVTVNTPGGTNIRATHQGISGLAGITVNTPGPNPDLIVSVDMVGDNRDGTVDIAFTVTNVGTSMTSQNVNVYFFENLGSPPTIETGFDSFTTLTLLTLPPGARWADIVVHTVFGGGGGVMRAFAKATSFAEINPNNNGSVQGIVWGATPGAQPITIDMDYAGDSGGANLDIEIYAGDGNTLMDFYLTHVWRAITFAGMEAFLKPERVYFLRVYGAAGDSYSLTASTAGLATSNGTIVGGSDPYEPDDSSGTATLLPLNQPQDHYLEGSTGQDWFIFMTPPP